MCYIDLGTLFICVCKMFNMSNSVDGCNYLKSVLIRITRLNAPQRYLNCCSYLQRNQGERAISQVEAI